MKVAPRDTGRFLQSPPPHCRAILIYGPDSGQVRQSSDRLLEALGVNKDDPFCFSELDGERIKDEPGALYDALQSMSLTGDTQAVLLRDVGDSLSTILKDALSDTGNMNTLILQGGDLPKRSSLRALMEDSKRKDLAAIACYRDEGRNLAQVIRGFLQERRIQASPPVIESLQSLLGNDRAVTLAELEKIDLYLGESRTLTEENVLALLGDNRHLLLSDAALAWLAGDQETFLRLSDSLYTAGESPVALLRLLSNGIQRLLSLHQYIAEGKTPDQAMAAVKPPVFFRDKPLYQRALKRRSPTQLMTLLGEVQQLEADCKRSQTPSLLVTHKLGISLFD